jgi:hypothetical protein
VESFADRPHGCTAIELNEGNKCAALAKTDGPLLSPKR